MTIPIPTRIKPKLGGEFTYPEMVPLVLTHSQVEPELLRAALSEASAQPGSQGMVQALSAVELGARGSGLGARSAAERECSESRVASRVGSARSLEKEQEMRARPGPE